MGVLSVKNCAFDTTTTEPWFPPSMPPIAIFYGTLDTLVLGKPLVERIRAHEPHVRLVKVVALENYGASSRSLELSLRARRRRSARLTRAPLFASQSTKTRCGRIRRTASATRASSRCCRRRRTATRLERDVALPFRSLYLLSSCRSSRYVSSAMF